MKLRNLFIVLLAVFMVIAFASCNSEPKDNPKPEPGPDTPTGIYQIEVTEGVDKDYWNRDKIKLEWEEEVNEGDVISLKYRTERDIYQWDIRDGSLQWVYESKKGSFTDPVLGDDGWYTLTYRFAKDKNGNDVDYPNEKFGVYFRGNFVTTDIFEIKDIKLNDKPLAVTSENIASKAKLTDPKIDFDWTVKNYTVLFATGTPGEVDKTPIAEKVVSGGFVTGAPIAKEGYTLKIFTDSSRTQEFDPKTPITEEKIFYYQYIGVPRTVTLDLKGGSFPENVEASATIANGSPFVAPAEPTKEGVTFKAWYKDSDCTTPWVMTDSVLGDMTLYAGYAEPRTVTFELNGGTFGEGVVNTKIVADGNAVARPETDPTNGSKMFLGWYADEQLSTIYDFTALVTADVKVYAAWVNATDVTLNLNYEGAPAAKTFKATLDVALSEDDENLVFVDSNVGWVFAGWYDDVACTEAKKHDFSALVTAPFTLYAKWEEATLYQLVSRHASTEGSDPPYSFDKFTLQFDDAKVNAGDVLSFRYRSTTDITLFSIRGTSKWIYEQPSTDNGALPDGFLSEPDDDGWITVSYTFTGKTYDGKADIPADQSYRFDFISRTIVVGDVLEIQDYAINGKEVAITDANVQKYNNPTVKVIEGGSYEWADLTVKFELMEGADAIDDKTVAFGKTIAKPEDPVVEGYKFLGWYADAEFTTPFDFNLPIIADATIYAKFEVKSGDTYTVTFNPNYEGAQSKAVEVDKGETVNVPAFGRPGYYLDGWYTESDSLVALDTATFEADTILYAKWKEPTKSYEYTVDDLGTVTKEGENYGKPYQADRIQFRWKDAKVGDLKNLRKGDTITFMVKTSVALPKIRVRTVTGSKNIFYYYTIPNVAVDTWMPVSLDITEDFLETGGITIALYNAEAAYGALEKDDVIEIKALAINGVEIPIVDKDDSSGLYPSFSSSKPECYGVNATLKVIKLTE